MFCLLSVVLTRQCSDLRLLTSDLHALPLTTNDSVAYWLKSPCALSLEPCSSLNSEPWCFPFALCIFLCDLSALCGSIFLAMRYAPRAMRQARTNRSKDQEESNDLNSAGEVALSEDVFWKKGDLPKLLTLESATATTAQGSAQNYNRTLALTRTCSTNWEMTTARLEQSRLERSPF